MRVLIVHSFYQQAGGEDAVVREEVEQLQSDGHEVSLFSVHNDEITGPWQKLKTFLLVVYNPFARRALAARIREFQPDVVHVHNFFPLLSPSVFDACEDQQVPAVLTLHNFRILCPTGVLYHDGQIREDSVRGSAWWTLRSRVYRNSLPGTLAVACMVEFHKWRGTWRNKVDRFIALSKFSKEKFVEGGLPVERLVVKPNAKSFAAANASSGGREGALFVGRLSDEKGVELLLRAWDNIDYPLRIAGDGPLRELVAEERNSNIEFLGRLDSEAVRAEMMRAAFLVLPSVCYEMFPMTLVEAFACGLPVITSRLGGLPDLVDDKVTGLLFEPGDPEDLRRTVSWATSHQDELLQMGTRACEQYRHRYSPDQNLRSLVDVYAELAGTSRAVEPQ